MNVLFSKNTHMGKHRYHLNIRKYMSTALLAHCYLLIKFELVQLCSFLTNLLKQHTVRQQCFTKDVCFYCTSHRIFKKYKQTTNTHEYKEKHHLRYFNPLRKQLTLICRSFFLTLSYKRGEIYFYWYLVRKYYCFLYFRRMNSFLRETY